MTRNQLKIIACISMLIDHIGYILFPKITILRYIGRIAMPIFAFFIGEGCLYTKNKVKYFLRVFILGLLCQSVYIIESLITHSGSGTYLNILLTFSVSIILCSAFIYMKESFETDIKSEKIKGVALFTFTFIAVLTLSFFCEGSRNTIGTEITFDYGLGGICLPLFAAVSKDKKKKLISFGIALTIFVFSFYESIYFSLWALVPFILLVFYNGTGGRKNLKYFFYAFYPVHLGVIYLIDILM
ncbi:MAG: hypothetical protein IJ491_09550 [Clostridia bacterium]|nr:hypothetical protein [Clostridia bacterium]